MKRLIASVTLLLIATCFVLSCEKDDICATNTPTTPSLIVEFYDKDNTEELVNVVNFKYYAVGETDTLPDVADDVTTTVNKIKLPLRTNATTTKWGLIFTRRLSNGQFTTPNTDFLEFNYTTNQFYVSRACGYKTTFTLNPDQPLGSNPKLTDSDAADGLWIDDISLETTNIENENETHLKIFL
ncbi:hypothetical protein HYN59_14505 [Flavobacterium album]|uniref:Uncharacterized protein n=1 Tax=Flavobacterium album TaxID=2175091 RepID=A0A2S1R0Y8_9FLAO|nr:DUF6452 family protein [Flavobacterium album]AWH86246.1 hypothetical protein HYN59_14505 [Flavobacterium album]